MMYGTSDYRFSSHEIALFGKLQQAAQHQAERMLSHMIKQLFYNGPSFETLHKDYAKKGHIDENAAIKTATEIHIAAPVERVWNHLINLSAWPVIDPSFQNVQLESNVEEDAYFRFVLNNFPIRAKFAVAVPNRELTWTGLSWWFKSIDLHVLEPAENNCTRLYIAESLAGVLASLFITSAQLRVQHDRWLAAFKRAAENGR
jgi:hypothetical protein